MDSWGREREVEKPKTVSGKRAAAVLHAEGIYVRLIQQGEAARSLAGRTAPVTETLFAGAAALRELIDLMPGGKA